MKIFIVGLPKSGKTTVAQAICNKNGYFYIGASWLQQSFRDKLPDETQEKYLEELQLYVSGRLKTAPNLYVDNINSIIKMYEEERHLLIDGICSPRDFVYLFDYNKDIIVFLNRTDNESYFKDFENVSISVIKDYCYWLSASGLLDKEKWLEYNFKIPGTDTDIAFKTLSNKNTVIIAKSINNVIKHLMDYLK